MKLLQRFIRLLITRKTLCFKVLMLYLFAVFQSSESLIRQKYLYTENDKELSNFMQPGLS